MGEVLQLPGIVAAPAGTGPTMSPDEVRDAAGGYKRPKDQLRELHARGFTRAYIAKVTGRVVLERGHYEAVIRGEFGRPAANDPSPVRPAPAGADVTGLKAFFAKKRK